MPSVTLQPEITRGRNALFLVLFTAFWNGITWLLFTVFLVTTSREDLAGISGVAFYGFFGIFMLIGLIMGILAVRALMTLRFAPMPVLTLSAESIPVGADAHLSWRIDGRRDAVQRLSLALEGKEEVQYTSGTDTSTDRHVFHRFTLYDSETGVLTTDGRSRVAIPANSMWSWAARNNKIVWLIRVKMRLAGLPSTDEAFLVTVVPAGAAR